MKRQTFKTKMLLYYMEGCRSEDGGRDQLKTQNSMLQWPNGRKGRTGVDIKKDGIRREKSLRIRGHTLGPSMGYICLVYRPQPLTKRGRRLLCIRSEGKGGLGIVPEKQRQASRGSEQRRASEDTPTERVASWIMGGPKADARPAALPPRPPMGRPACFVSLAAKCVVSALLLREERNIFPISQWPVRYRQSGFLFSLWGTPGRFVLISYCSLQRTIATCMRRWR